MIKSILQKIFGFYKSTKDTYEQKLDEQVKGFLGVEESLESEKPKSKKTKKVTKDETTKSKTPKKKK